MKDCLRLVLGIIAIVRSPNYRPAFTGKGCGRFGFSGTRSSGVAGFGVGPGFGV